MRTPRQLYENNRKLLLSLGVTVGVVFLISIGVWIHGSITNGAEEHARLYQTAIQTKNDKELNYSIDTRQGRVLAEVTVGPVDLVKFKEMNKKFVKVKKTKERYTRHERTVCETHYRTETRTRSVYDPTTQNYTTESYTEQVPYDVCRQETYYSWDRVDSWEKSAKKVDMAGRKYSIGLFSLGTRSINASDIIKGEKEKYVYERSEGLFSFGLGDSEGDIRYKYYVLQLPMSGTVFLDVREAVRPVFGNRVALDVKKPSQLVTDVQKAAETKGTVFVWFWGFLVVICAGFGVYFVWIYEE